MKLLAVALGVGFCMLVTLTAQRLMPTYTTEGMGRRLLFQLLARGIALVAILGFVGIAALIGR